MTKKRVKEELKSPDIVTQTFTAALDYVRANTKVCMVAGVAIICIVLTAYGYILYTDRKSERVQYMLSEAIGSFEGYSANGSGELLNKAETLFQNVRKEKLNGPYNVANLYLAKIYSMKGMKEEAKKRLQEAAGDSSATIRLLAEKALSQP